MKRIEKWLRIAVPIVGVAGFAAIGYVLGLRFIARTAPAASSALAEWGPAYATEGTLRIVELAHKSSQAGTSVIYGLQASGLPDDVTYMVWLRRWVSAAPEQTVPVRLDSDGVAIRPDTGEVATFEFGSWPRAEPVALGLMSEDKSVRVFDQVIPFPVEATSANGCRIWLELTSPSGKEFSVHGDGFEGNELLSVSAGQASSGLKLEFADKTDADGAFEQVLGSTMFVNETSGRAPISVEGSRCQVDLWFDFGTAALQVQ